MAGWGVVVAILDGFIWVLDLRWALRFFLFSGKTDRYPAVLVEKRVLADGVGKFGLDGNDGKGKFVFL